MARYDKIFEFESNLDGKGLRIGIVMSRFNIDVCEGLLSACTAALLKTGVKSEDITLTTVAGRSGIAPAAEEDGRDRQV
jgi:6,7-dimethyl-8-ribityllumazine synthase